MSFTEKLHGYISEGHECNWWILLKQRRSLKSLSSG